jgi:hypothetical protein
MLEPLCHPSSIYVCTLTSYRWNFGINGVQVPAELENVRGRKSSEQDHRLVPECHTPRRSDPYVCTYVVGLPACRILDECGSDFPSVYMRGVHPVVNGRWACMLQVLQSVDFEFVAGNIGHKAQGIQHWESGNGNQCAAE